MEGPSVSSSKDTMDEHDGSIVTMCDVLEEETKLENDAQVLLGAVDDKTCTYAEGYVKRQPLYACVTCVPPGGEVSGGVCLACCYHCHEGHDLTELYTKRNFRCDCGNSKFTSKCNLDPIKDVVNEKNEYNQNFKGVYCTCKRPYPDPEDKVPDEMIQCAVCEDWFHGRHLDGEGHSQVDYAEMICQVCMVKLPFLWNYTHLFAKKANLDESTAASTEESPKEEETVTTQTPTECKLPAGGEVKAAATFWQESWRKNICSCSKCLEMYAKLKVEFLTDEKDTSHYYEAQSKANAKETGYEKGMKALSELGQVQQIEAIQGYNQMKTELMAYLQKFAENGKVVREEDITEFFGQMKERKKARVELQYSCR